MLACLGASLGLAPAHLRGPAARLALGRATRAFSGPRQAVIEERLASAFAPLHVVVENTSHGARKMLSPTASAARAVRAPPHTPPR